MFKAARWRSDKNKVKAVFRMQFVATQISHTKWDALVVYLIPLVGGKPTARTEKSFVSNGSCHWDKPIYETVKFVQEPKTGIIHNKIYRIIVSAAGSPKAAVLGEATIDFADYAKATKPCSASLPLRASDSGMLLHVTIQRLQDEVNERESEESIEKMVKPQWRVLKSQLRNCDKEESYTITSGNNDNSNIADRPTINGEVQMILPATRAMVLHAESDDNLKKSNSLDAMSVSASDCSSGPYTMIKYGPKNSRNIHQDSRNIFSPLSNSSTPRKPTFNSTSLLVNYGDHRRSNTDWSVSSAADGTMDGSTNSADENELRGRIQDSNVSLNKLKYELVALSRQAEASELELQSLRKQVVKERRKREDLSRDFCNMKEERDTFRRECELLNAFYGENGDKDISDRPQFNGEDLRSIIEKIKQELSHEKSLNANLRLQLQKTQKSNSELILAVSDLNEMLKQKSRKTSNCGHMFDTHLGNGNSQGRNHGNGSTHLQDFENSKQPCETPFVHEQDAEQYALEALANEHDMMIGFSLEQKVTDLNNETESYRKDNEELEMQMEQLALDYEILKQENHDVSLKLEQTQLREQLRMQYECSAHTTIINDLEARVESLEKELEKQVKVFEVDLSSVMEAKVEQEKRAIQLQEALTKAKWKNVTTAEYLQEELKRLLIQMSSTLSENEKLATLALAEASELRQQKSQLEELLEKANVEVASIHDHCTAKLQDLTSEIDLERRLTEQLVIELQGNTEELENQKKSEAKRTKAFSEEMLKLKAQVELLVREKNDIYQQLKQKDDSIGKVEQPKREIKVTEMFLENKNREMNVLERKYSLVRDEANELSEKLNELRLLKEEKESVIQTLNSELATLKADHNNLKSSVFENNLEKENLRKQVLHLRDDLQKKKDMITTLKKRFMGNNVISASPDSSARNKKNGSAFVPHQGVTCLPEKVKPLKETTDMKGRTDCHYVNEEKNEEVPMKYNLKEKSCACISNDMVQGSLVSKKGIGSKLDEALTGYPCDHGNMAKMFKGNGSAERERNELMGAELKEMQERYPETSLKFAEVEGERP